MVESSAPRSGVRQPLVGTPSPGNIPFHEYADLFPMIGGPEFAEFAADIGKRGRILNDIVLFEDAILDGRNRYSAGIGAGLIDPNWGAGELVSRGFARWFEPAFEGEALGWVLSQNLHRRHLSASQLSMVAADLGKLRQGRPSEWRLPADGPASVADPSSALRAPRGEGEGPRPLTSRGEGDNGDDESSLQNVQIARSEKPASLRDKPTLTQQQRADLVGVSERQVQTADHVKEHAAPEVVDAVRRGEMKVSAAAELASLPITEQIAIMRSADPRAIGRLARERRAEQQLEKRERRDGRAADLATKHRALPQIKAGIIVADPAWRDEEVWSDATGMDRAADNHYPTMSLREVMDLDVDAIAAPDAILFLWCKTNNLVEAICVAIAWGFAALEHDEVGHIIPGRTRRYVSELAWDKELIGNGRWVRDRHEHLLIFRRGNPVAPAPGTQLPSVWTERKTDHSSKPEGILEWIERTWPDEVKIELNRRGAPRPGWHAWGNEVEDGEPVSQTSQRRASNSDESSPEAGPRAEASHSQGTGAGTLADREARHDGEGASVTLPNLDIDALLADPERMYGAAIALVQATGKASAALLQRQFHIGYNRASHFIERMEAEGIVSAPSAAGMREVISHSQHSAGAAEAVGQAAADGAAASAQPEPGDSSSPPAAAEVHPTPGTSAAISASRSGMRQPLEGPSRLTFEQAKPILEARYRATPGAVLAAELGLPVSTLRTWAQQLDLTSVDRRREQLVERNKSRAKGQEARP